MKATFHEYTLDSDGYVLSKRTGIKLKTALVKGGYHSLGLQIDRVRKQFLLHRIIAIAFIPNGDNKPHINHKDGNKNNNSVENLEWVTPKENAKHAFNTGLRAGRKLGDHPMSRLTLDTSMGIYYDSVQEAKIARNITKKGLRSSMARHAQSRKYNLMYV